jgi:CBS-domain-containing membrane protein
LGQKFKVLWKNYLYQSALATAVIFIVFWILTAKDAVIVTSLGATAFIIFAAPSSPAAQPKRVIGGEIVGCLCGAIGVLLLNNWSISPTIIDSLVIGLSIFVMVATDLYQPPAAGTALGIALTGSPLKVLITVGGSVIFLTAIRHFLKRYLRDLV